MNNDPDGLKTRGVGPNTFIKRRVHRDYYRSGCHNDYFRVWATGLIEHWSAYNKRWGSFGDLQYLTAFSRMFYLHRKMSNLEVLLVFGRTEIERTNEQESLL